MSRKKCLFKQTDVKRAVKAAEKAGLCVERIEIENTGKIALVTREIMVGREHTNETNPWDTLG